MSKQLTPLEALEKNKILLKQLLSQQRPHLNLSDIDNEVNKEFVVIETALKEHEKQDLILNFLKEHIVFEDGVVKANFQWEIDDKETEEAVKEWLK